MILLSFVACSSDNDIESTNITDTQYAITFSSSLLEDTESNNRSTRANSPKAMHEIGVTDFTVYGIKGNTTNDGNFTYNSTIYPNYKVVWTSNSANTTSTNSSGWDYAGINSQKVKYWDYGYNTYYFWAIAKADNGKFVDGQATFDDQKRVATYTKAVTASDSEADAFYYSKLHITAPDHSKPVSLKFIPYMSKVRVGFYETVQGYLVNNLKVSTGAGTETSNSIVVNGDFVSSGTCELTYNYSNSKITSSITPTGTSTSKNFGAVQYQTLTPRTSNDEDYLTSATTGTYLARSSDNASFALGGGADKNYYMNVLPNGNNTTPLTFKCSYSLVDPSSGTTTSNVADAMVTVPAEYVKWEPGYEYTYIFKITKGAAIEFDLSVYVKKWIEQEVNHPVYNW